MNSESLYKGQKLMDRIRSLESFISRTEMGDKLSHIVVIHRDNTKNVSIPDEFSRVVLDEARAKVMHAIEVSQKEFNELV